MYVSHSDQSASFYYYDYICSRYSPATLFLFVLQVVEAQLCNKTGNFCINIVMGCLLWC